MSYRSDIKTAACPRCKTGRVMSGELQRKHNAKDEDGKIVCVDCKMKDIYASISK